MSKATSSIDRLTKIVEKILGRTDPYTIEYQYIEGKFTSSSGSNPTRVDDLPPMRFPPITDLSAEILEMGDTLRSLLGDDVLLTLNCDPCPGEVFLDSEALLRLLFKLAANSLEAMHSQLISNQVKRINIAVQRANGSSFLPRSCWPSYANDSVMLSFSDSGPGIAIGDLPQLFDPRFRVWRQWWRRRTGQRPEDKELSAMGIPRGPKARGLLTVRRIVERAKGGVRVISIGGVGTQFDIEFPISPQEQLGGQPPRRLSLVDRN